MSGLIGVSNPKLSSLSIEELEVLRAAAMHQYYCGGDNDYLPLEPAFIEFAEDFNELGIFKFSAAALEIFMFCADAYSGAALDAARAKAVK